MNFQTRIRHVLFWAGLCSLGVAVYLVIAGYYLGGAVWYGLGGYILWKTR